MLETIKYLYRAYRFRYKIDPQEITYIRRNLRPGDIAVDIGCHKGAYAYWMRKSVGETGQVFAFEPQTKLYTYLREIFQLQQYTNVQLENIGFSDQTGTVHFYIPDTAKGDSPGARIGQLDDGTSYREVSIDVTTLDQYFLAAGICPQLIKIDVEGHERYVLQGGRKLLQQCRPKLIMECENRHLEGESILDVFQLLLDIGYQGYFFKGNDLQPLAEFDVERDQKMGEGRFWEAEGYINNFVFEPIDSL